MNNLEKINVIVTGAHGLGAALSYREIMEAIIYAITRPRHGTIASMIMDSSSQGIDDRSHLKENG